MWAGSEGREGRKDADVKDVKIYVKTPHSSSRRSDIHPHADEAAAQKEEAAAQKGHIRGGEGSGHWDRPVAIWRRPTLVRGGPRRGPSEEGVGQGAARCAPSFSSPDMRLILEDGSA